MSYKKHAMKEFEIAGWIKDGKWSDDMQKLICEQVLELLDLFSKHGHSGSSAPYALNLFRKLARFEPITPLTGEDWEWNKCEIGWQNKRCSHVFKDKNGRAYDIEGKIFKDKRNGTCYTNKNSWVYIKFPYKPKRKFVNEK